MFEAAVEGRSNMTARCVVSVITPTKNRLKLLSQIVETAHQVADFSKVEG